jgi:hypothetical protein
MGLTLYNKIINLTFTKNNLTVCKITCPSTGRKPNIKISGTLTGGDTLTQLEIRIKNFYSSSLISQGMSVMVNAGYETSLALAVKGEITSIYTANPAPESETVITCTVAALEDYITTPVDILVLNPTVSSVVNAINAQLKFSAPYIDSSLKAKKIDVPFYAKGTVKDAVSQFKRYFGDIANISISRNRITVTPPDKGTSQVFTLTALKSPPCLCGTTVSVTALWDPEIRPQDYIKVNSDFYKSDISSATRSLKKYKYLVSTIAFSFSTITDDNTMTIVATSSEG